MQADIMKRLIICVVISMLFSVSVQAHSALKEKTKNFKNSKRFAVTYDRFKDRTWVRVGPFIDRLSISASFTFEGESQSAPVSEITLIFYSYSSDWRFLNNRDLYVIVDGERMDLGEGARSGSVTSRYRSVGVTETLVFAVPFTVFEKFTNAKSVEFKVGPIETSLKDEHLTAFRDLLSLVRRF